MPEASVTITTEGRGGSIHYHEGDETVAFHWEFALPPALALIFGPPAAGWDRSRPWAAGRQAEIYEFVGREVVRRKAAGYTCDLDLERGIIEVHERRGSR